jgi:hypothetical protein
MKFIFVILLFPIQLFAQNISGVWKGHLYNDTTKQFMPYELAIDDDNGKLNGYSYTIFMIDSIKMVGVKTVKIKNRDELFFVEDEKLIYNNYIEPPAKGVRMFSILSYSKSDSAEILSGSWNTNATNEYSPLTGTISLEKKKPVKDIAIIGKLDEIGLINKLSFINIDRFNKEKNREKTLVAVNTIPPEQQQFPAAKKDEKMVAATDQKQNERKDIAAKPEEKNNKKASVAENNIPPKQQQFPTAKKDEKIIAAVDQKRNERKDIVAKPGEKNNKKTSVAIDSIPPKQQQSSAVKKDEKMIAAVDQKQNGKNDVITKDQATAASPKNKRPPGEGKIAQKSSLPVDNKPVAQKIPESSKNKNLPENKIEDAGEPLQQEKDLSKTKENIVEKSLPPITGKVPSGVEKPAINEVAAVTKIPVTPPAAQIASRKIETIRTVEIVNDSLVLSLFDNGVIDGDTVTVLVNGNVVWPMVGLLERSANKTIYLTPEMGDSISVVMYAESLGSIPPNTGLLVIRDGNTNHEIRFSGDLKKNSAIILKRKKVE